jgi:hypothetical protein
LVCLGVFWFVLVCFFAWFGIFWCVLAWFSVVWHALGCFGYGYGKFRLCLISLSNLVRKSGKIRALNFASSARNVNRKSA